MKYQLPPGVFDIIPEDAREPWRSSYIWLYLEDLLRTVAQQYGYLEIRTPVIERTELFQRSVGESSDIVSKEMYTFEDRGGRSLSLRPEGTAAVMRAFVNGNLQQLGPVHKLYYIGPMFRYDRPQAGRYRQHHQFGAEAVGCHSPEQDAEIIDMAYTIYSRLGLKNLSVQLNTIGDDATRVAFRDALRAHLQPHFEQLSDDSKTRLETNPLRILDSKDPRDKELCADAPSILDFLTDESRDYFAEVCRLLDSLKIAYTIDSNLVRGLDYYNQTVFEVVSNDLGAQSSIGGGGRYDGLLKSLGGPDLPAVGFATGMERIIQTMLKQEAPLPPAPGPTLFLIPLGDAARHRCFTLLGALRQEGLNVQMDFTGRKLGKVMNHANQLRARYVAVVGDSELDTETVELKDMESGKKQPVRFDALADVLNQN